MCNDHWGRDCRDVTTTKLIAVSKYPKSTVGGSGQGGFERRIEVFVRIQKKKFGRAGRGVGRGGSGWM